MMMQPHVPQPGNNAAGFTQLPQQSIFQANVVFTGISIRYNTGQYAGVKVNPNFELTEYRDPQTGKNLFAYANVCTFDDIQKSILERLSTSKSNGKQLTIELLQATGFYNMSAGIPAAATLQLLASQVGKTFTATIQRDVSKDGQRIVLRVMSLNVQQPQPMMQQPQQVSVSNQVLPSQGIAQVNVPAPVALDSTPPITNVTLHKYVPYEVSNPQNAYTHPTPNVQNVPVSQADTSQLQPGTYTVTTQTSHLPPDFPF